MSFRSSHFLGSEIWLKLLAVFVTDRWRNATLKLHFVYVFCSLHFIPDPPRESLYCRTIPHRWSRKNTYNHENIYSRKRGGSRKFICTTLPEAKNASRVKFTALKPRREERGSLLFPIRRSFKQCEPQIVAEFSELYACEEWKPDCERRKYFDRETIKVQLLD